MISLNTTVLSKTNRGSSNSKRYCAGRRPGDNPPLERFLQGRLVGPCDRKLANALRIDINSSVLLLQRFAIRREELSSQQSKRSVANRPEKRAASAIRR